MNEEDIYRYSERTEEIQNIIERMPTKFGVWISSIVLFIVATLCVFGYLIKYPDVVVGQVIINANISPVKLIASSSGNIYLNGFHSLDQVKKGDYIAIIKNSAILNDILTIQPLIKQFNLNNPNQGLSKFPRNLFLGDLNIKYYNFINAYEQYNIYQKENVLTKQEEILTKTMLQQQDLISVSKKKLKMSLETVRLMNKFYSRDSTLFAEKVLTEAEIDKSQMSNITAKDAYHTMLNNITSLQEQFQESSNKLQQVGLQRNDKKKQVFIDLIAAYTDLSDNIKVWEQKFVFKAPIDGKVQFLKFWSNDQFVQAGEAVFTIVPRESTIMGQMVLPAAGAGKVKIGQDVVLKLDNYPFAEYGSITGKVATISLTTNPVKTTDGEIDTYLVNILLPEQLKTNYGSKLDFKFEIKGKGEIITKSRKLVERLFDNLKYVMNN